MNIWNFEYKREDTHIFALISNHIFKTLQSLLRQLSLCLPYGNLLLNMSKHFQIKKMKNRSKPHFKQDNIYSCICRETNLGLGGRRTMASFRHVYPLPEILVYKTKVMSSVFFFILCRRLGSKLTEFFKRNFQSAWYSYGQFDHRTSILHF